MYSDSLNPFGMLKGQLVTVNDVPSGLACGCLCPACGAPLVARKGPQKVHHFSHSVKTDCKGALETALHIKAKSILESFSFINLPNHWPPSPDPLYFYPYSSVHLETRIGKIRPDVVLDGYNSPLIVEIYVTHRTEWEKIDEIKRLELPAIEIDLRYLKKHDLLDDKLIENGVVHCVHTKSWLNMPKLPMPRHDTRSLPIDDRKLQLRRAYAQLIGGEFLGMSQRAKKRFGR